MTWVVPDEAVVADFLRNLLNRGASVRKSSPPSADRAVVLAEYGASSGPLRFFWVCDVPMGAYLGASLSLLSFAVAAEAIRAGKVPDSLAENLQEVFNVGARLFDGIGVRIALKRVFFSAVPIEVVKQSEASTQRADFEVSLTGYGTGKMSLCLAADSAKGD